MKEPNPINNVAEFHSTFNHPIVEKPGIPNKTRCDLRVSLIAEELEELKEAIADKDIIEIADALCDIQYVLSGAILEFGLGDKFKELFEEVHRSNMSKSCHSIEEAEQTLAHYKTNHNMDGYIKEKDGKYLVYRQGDNKTLKSINYSPADLKNVLEK